MASADLPIGANLPDFICTVADKVKSWNKFLAVLPEKLAKLRVAFHSKELVSGPQDGGANDGFDVIIIGFGAAGASAALEAADLGARVLIIDAAEGGGATQRSGGVIYLGGGTKSQSDAGFVDDADNMYKCLKFESELAVDDDRLRAFCNESKANFEWLSQHNVPFANPDTGKVAYHAEKCSLPPGESTLYWSGNELAHPWSSLADPAPRGHWPWMPGTEQSKDHLSPPCRGHVLFNALAEAIDKNPNIEVRPHCKGVRVIMEEGRVVGLTVRELAASRPLRSLRQVIHMMGTASVEYDTSQNVRRECLRYSNDIFQEFGVEYDVLASGGVVVSAGGFFFNDEMVKQHAPKYQGNMALGSLGDDGSGITIGVEAGGATAMMGRCTAWKFLAPPKGFLNGIFVDTVSAKRITNEDPYNAKVIDRVMARADGRAWLLLDSNMYESIRADTADGSNDLYPFQRMMAALFTESATKRDSWPGLARACGLPAGALEATIEKYNVSVHNGHDAEFGKKPAYMKPFGQAPFYAIPINARTGELKQRLLRAMPAWGMELARYLPTLPLVRLAMWMGMPFPPTATFTLGGLRVDLEQRVLHEKTTSAIPGLYAAGRSAAGVASGGYVSGLSIADAVYSGRRAGRHAASNATKVLPAQNSAPSLLSLYLAKELDQPVLLSQGVRSKM